MVENAPKPFWSGWVKVAGMVLAGGLFGFLMARTLGQSFEDGGTLAAFADAEISLLVAALYVLMGLFVLLGTISPRVGAAILNVEDAEEVREQAPVLLPSALGCVLIGVALAAIALGGAGEFLNPYAAGVIAIVSLLAATAISLTASRRSDELMRALFKDAGSASFYILATILAIWTAAGHMSLARSPTALEVLTLVFAAPLVASFWVIGRRGMLGPR